MTGIGYKNPSKPQAGTIVFSHLPGGCYVTVKRTDALSAATAPLSVHRTRLPRMCHCALPYPVALASSSGLFVAGLRCWRFPPSPGITVARVVARRLPIRADTP